MQNLVKIKKIVDVISGYTFRGAIKEDPESSLYVLQAKNIRDDLVIDDNSLVTSSCDTSHTKSFAKNGDVAITVRGAFRAAVIFSSKNILASSSVLLLRLIKDNVMIPEYIAMCLNSSIGQHEIGQIVTGAAIKLILRGDIENIKIPVISIPKQKKLVSLFQNIKTQEKLLERKKEIQKNIINGTFNKIVRE